MHKQKRIDEIETHKKKINQRITNAIRIQVKKKMDIIEFYDKFTK